MTPSPDFKFFVHIAGPMTDGLQRCSICGDVLFDYRHGYVVLDPERQQMDGRGWTEGAFVATAGPCSIVLDHDACELDDTACGGLLQ